MGFGWKKLASALDAFATAYAQIYFARGRITGLLFFAATLAAPWQGLSGLLGLWLANGFARLLGRPSEQIREGYFGFNGLLLGLALGLYFRFSVPFFLLLVIGALLTVIVSALLRNLSERFLGVPVLSLSFVLATWIAILAARRFVAVEATIHPILFPDPAAGLLPEIVELYLRSMAAAFFHQSTTSGMLVFLGLLCFSRWATFLSFIGFLVGYWTYVGLGGPSGDLRAELVGFNFILTAIALGGVWIVLGPASILYASAGAALSALLSAALLIALRDLALPVLAMPFILATQLLIFAAMIRSDQRHLQIVRGKMGSPESNLNRAVYLRRRYPSPSIPVVFMPVMGRWTITQGPDGETTHRGIWSHAWDFEVIDEEGAKFAGAGDRPEDYFAYGAPVVAPGEGKVVRVVGHLKDNPVGAVDTQNAWGNLVILWHGSDLYSALCHLQKGSLKVKEGDTVVAGQVLGRVGNSGRSPVPHLHFQFQGSSEIGAPTRYVEFLHYCSMRGESTEYITHGLPREGDIVSALQIDEEIRRNVDLSPGRIWEWSVKTGDRTRRESWCSKIDPVGLRELVDTKGKGRVSFYADSHYTTMLDYHGAPDSLLGLLYLGLARTPHVRDDRFTWGDSLSGAPFLGPFYRIVRDLVLPFRELAQIRTSSRLQQDGDRVKVITEIDIQSAAIVPKDLPSRVEITLESGFGPTALRAFRGDSLLVAADIPR